MSTIIPLVSADKYRTPPGEGKFPLEDRIYGLMGDSPMEILYRQMFGIRRFEEKLLNLFEQGVLTGTTHCCIGQEANCVGVIRHLQGHDHVFSNHRCHGHYLAWTGDPIGLLAEIMGKRSGVCTGVGGSQHLCVKGFKSNGILGGTVANAAGIALGYQLLGQRSVSLVFTGDGALGEGIIYETFNISSLWSLPLVIVVENNGWSQSTAIKNNLAGTFGGRFSAFNISYEEVDGFDPIVIDEAAGRAIEAARDGKGPQGLIINTYRFCHHSKNDDNRDAAEVEERRKLDPLILQSRRISEVVRERIESEVETAINTAVNIALELE